MRVGVAPRTEDVAERHARSSPVPQEPAKIRVARRLLCGLADMERRPDLRAARPTAAPEGDSLIHRLLAPSSAPPSRTTQTRLKPATRAKSDALPRFPFSIRRAR
ncbi:hypothetical protein [Sandaracinus amylolyticus]|uniref:hypothetical protein n=1 Tax=Sandaracinus amylolyticus TaxID=927083 RepID=UPI001F402148|nr:hypothetical protein [Sandaracinus amylolyticus]